MQATYAQSDGIYPPPGFGGYNDFTGSGNGVEGSGNSFQGDNFQGGPLPPLAPSAPPGTWTQAHSDGIDPAPGFGNNRLGSSHDFNGSGNGFQGEGGNNSQGGGHNFQGGGSSDTGHLNVPTIVHAIGTALENLNQLSATSVDLRAALIQTNRAGTQTTHAAQQEAASNSASDSAWEDASPPQ